MGCVGIYITRQGTVTVSVSRSCVVSLQLIRQGTVTVSVSRSCVVSLQLLMLSAENGLWIMTEDGKNYINLR
ncbi:MAG: hypothetical protein ACI305_00360 [Lepagella sp.]